MGFSRKFFVVIGIALFFASFTAASPFATTLTYTYPSTALVLEPFDIEINYTAVLDNGTTYLITEPYHNGTCYFIFDSITFATYYNPEKQNYNLTFNTNTAGNYTPTFECFADNHDMRNETGSNIEIKPANTTMSLWSNTTNKTVTLTTAYYWSVTSEKGGDTEIINEERTTCNASLYDSSDNLLLETALDLDGYFYAKTLTLNSEGSYHWNASCSGLPNYNPANSTSDALYIEGSECNEVNVTSNTNVTSGKTCSGESTTPLYSITTSDVELNCNGNTLDAIGNNLQRESISVANASNVTISNCRLDNYAAGITLFNATKVTLKNIVTNNSYYSLIIVNSSNFSLLDSEFSQGINDNSPLNGRTAISLVGNSQNPVFSNLTIHDYLVGLIVDNVTNASFTDFNLINVSLGIFLNGNNNTLQRISLSNVSASMALIGENNLVENFTTRNSPFVGLEPTIYLITNKTTLTNLVVYNSSSDAIWLFGQDNILFVNLTNTNGTGLTLLGDTSPLDAYSLSKPTSNNLIHLNGFTGNKLDIKMNDSTGELYNNTFIGNFSSIFANVTNTTRPTIATFSNLTLAANGALVTYSNLTLLNSTNFVNLSDITTAFQLSSTSAFLDSSATSFLSQSATIKLTGATYTNNSAYDVLKDGSVCNTCVKLASNPAEFQVLGFSNYSTRQIQLDNNQTQQNTSSSTSPSSPPSSPPSNPPSDKPPSTTPTTPQANVTNTTQPQNNTVAPVSNTTTTSNTTASVTQPLANGTTTAPLTGLFAAVPKELQNPVNASAVVIAVLALAGIGYSLYAGKITLNKPTDQKLDAKQEKKKK